MSAANPKQRGAPFSLTIGGKDYLQERLGRIEVRESLKEPLQIHVTLVPSESVPLSNSFVDAPVTLKFDGETANRELYSFAKGGKTEYHGYVAQERKIFLVDGTLGGVTLTIYHPLYLLHKGSHARIFSINTETPKEGENKLEEIFDKVLTPYKPLFAMFGVFNIVYDMFPQESIPYLVQYQESDYHFLLRLCETYGIHFTQESHNLIFSSADSLLPLSSYELAAESTCLWEYAAANNGRMLESRDSHYDAAYSELPDAIGTASAAVGLGLIEQYDQRHHMNNEEGQKLLAVTGMFLEHSQEEMHLWSQLWPVPESKPLVGVRTGDCICPPGGDGEFFVHEVIWHYQGTETIGAEATQQKGNESYRIDVRSRDSMTAYAPPPDHPKPRIAGFHKAIMIAPAVKERSDKSAQYGRIKVRFLWDKDKEQRLVDKPEYTCWIRLVMPYAGKDHGFYVMPEVGDELIIAYEDGDIDRPLCLGSVYNVESEMLTRMLTEMQPENYTAQMETVKLKTPKNLMFEMWEAEQQDSKQRIQLDTNKKITMTMNIKDEDIAYSLNSEGTVSVHSVGQMTEDSDLRVIVKRGSKGSMTIDPDGAITIDSDQQILIKRGDKASIFIDVNGNIEIKANTLKIVTKGNTEVNAELIKLNC